MDIGQRAEKICFLKKNKKRKIPVFWKKNVLLFDSEKKRFKQQPWFQSIANKPFGIIMRVKQRLDTQECVSVLDDVSLTSERLEPTCNKANECHSLSNHVNHTNASNALSSSNHHNHVSISHHATNSTGGNISSHLIFTLTVNF